MRGKRHLIDNVLAFLRITPACAGKTKQNEYIYGDTEDHPRVCGENLGQLRKTVRESGSPPRVRGKHGGKRIDHVGIRITPACAGKTYCFDSTGYTTQDHPRVCGENVSIRFPVRQRLGSPPRVRGKHFTDTQGNNTQRITPACAGKTNRAGRRARPPRDHPRVCGENVNKTQRFKKL